MLAPQAGPSRPPAPLDRMPALLGALPTDPPAPSTPPCDRALAAARLALNPLAAHLPAAYLPLFALWCEARATYYSARRDRALLCWQWGLYAAVWVLQLVGAHTIGRRNPQHLTDLLDDLGITPPARRLSPFRDWLEGTPYTGSDPLQAIPGVRVTDPVQRSYIGRAAFPLTADALDAFAQLVTAVTPRLGAACVGAMAQPSPMRGPPIVRPPPPQVLPATAGPAGGIDDPMGGPPCGPLHATGQLPRRPATGRPDHASALPVGPQDSCGHAPGGIPLRPVSSLPRRRLAPRPIPHYTRQAPHGLP